MRTLLCNVTVTHFIHSCDVAQIMLQPVAYELIFHYLYYNLTQCNSLNLDNNAHMEQCIPSRRGSKQPKWDTYDITLPPHHLTG